MDLPPIRITLLSDLHREFYSSSKKLFAAIPLSKLPDTDICVLAGDISHPLLIKKHQPSKLEVKEPTVNPSFVALLRAFKLKYQTVLYVSGNHEYYQAKEMKITDLAVIDKVIRAACEEVGIVFLNCNTWIDTVHQVEWVGCTLWSMISERTYQQMEDRNALSFETYIRTHLAHVKWLTATLESESKYRRIVITHHLPSLRMVHPKYKFSTINDGFCSNLEHLFRPSTMIGWVCGHTHERMNTRIAGIKVVCNPLGYPGEKRETSFCYDAEEFP